MANVKVGDKVKIRGSKIKGTIIQDCTNYKFSNPYMFMKVKHEDNTEMVYNIDEIRKDED
jgi:hypothetical protein